MMLKPRLLLALFVLLVLCLSSVAYAQTAAVAWKDSLGRDLTWKQVGSNWELNLQLNWAKDWGVGTSSQPYEMSGEPPCVDDPTITQEIFNETTGWWTDWHVDISNGWFVSGEAYNLNRQSPSWVVELSNPDLQGRMTRLFAHVVSGHDTQIYPNEILFLSFNYVAGSAGSVKLTQYPTADVPIPEPASLVALATGIMAFGFSIRRRK